MSSRSPKLLPPLPQNCEGDPASNLLDGQDLPYLCLPACPCQPRVSEVPSLPLGSLNLCVYLPTLRALSGPCCLPGSHKLPLETLQSARNCVSSLSRYIITFASSEWKGWEDLLFGQDTLVHLEFFLNLEKSKLVPTQSLVWLGASWVSRNLSPQLPLEAAKVIVSMTSSLLEMG